MHLFPLSASYAQSERRSEQAKHKRTLLEDVFEPLPASDSPTTQTQCRSKVQPAKQYCRPYICDPVFGTPYRGDDAVVGCGLVLPVALPLDVSDQAIQTMLE